MRVPLRACLILLFLLASSVLYASPKKIVLVTGASSGIGKAVVEELGSRSDFIVYGTTRQKQLVGQYNGYQLIEMNPGITESVREAVASIEARGRAVDVLINNAGYMVLGSVESVEPEQLLELFNVNVVGYQRTTQAVVPGMRDRKQGLIINVSSVQAFDPRGLQESYSATRSAVETLSLGQSGYLADYGIKVLVFQPGATRTSIINNSHIGSRRVERDTAGAGTNQFLSFLQQRFNQGEEPKRVVKKLVQLIDESRPDFRTQANERGMARAQSVYKDAKGNQQRIKQREKHQQFVRDFIDINVDSSIKKGIDRKAAEP
ncbi:hypothetical protein EOPP23_04930 [Endozoicomonas sp. OPT23]|uniref:SDR family NAD(P)-dependent oxidoreductase n=1 Tax=Endozoicomonas sp. OPT23 TaxID=2072845 RepID=UPI00129A27C1|nr:SDR family NAD(P)-dependent oxidoreductase [Endozoicomonas sp. OPT23]MRI32328.1 hypothetical protein [Endozoicomonas sp. OPT23]